MLLEVGVPAVSGAYPGRAKPGRGAAVHWWIRRRSRAAQAFYTKKRSTCMNLAMGIIRCATMLKDINVPSTERKRIYYAGADLALRGPLVVVSSSGISMNVRLP